MSYPFINKVFFKDIKAYGISLTKMQVEDQIKIWKNSCNSFESFLIIASTKTSEIKGISCAGLTPEARRFTPIADAEMLLYGPSALRRRQLPALQKGVSPSIISYVSTDLIGVKPKIIAAGLYEIPSFEYLNLDDCQLGPSECLSTGQTMSKDRVDELISRSITIGSNLDKPLVISECVPGGTTTAQAVLMGMGLDISNFISSSLYIPPISLKTHLIKTGLDIAKLEREKSSSKLISTLGDPFQAIATGLILGARLSDKPVLLGGGCQMLAVLCLSLLETEPHLRNDFMKGIAIGTTSWLINESINNKYFESSFLNLMKRVCSHFDIGLSCFCPQLNFSNSKIQRLRDFEHGHVKEGVGAGAYALLAEMNGFYSEKIMRGCESVINQIQKEDHCYD